jgi:HEAT repeat protein
LAPLLVALRDLNDSWLRREAAAALGSIGDPSAVSYLTISLIDSSSQVRQAAAAALGKIGDPRAVHPLVDALDDREANVRQAAAEALGKLDRQADPTENGGLQAQGDATPGEQPKGR